MPAASILSHPASSIIDSFLIIISPVIGCLTSNAVTLPRALSDKLTTTLPPSKISESSINPGLSQFFLVIVKSCATSHNRLVKYPELAVLRAVSANPFLAPCVELKYSNAVKPSLKLEVIGLQ